MSQRRFNHKVDVEISRQSLEILRSKKISHAIQNVDSQYLNTGDQCTRQRALRYAYLTRKMFVGLLPQPTSRYPSFSFGYGRKSQIGLLDDEEGPIFSRIILVERWFND